MQGAQLGIDCNNSGMQFSVGVSTQTRADVMPSLDEVEDGRPWMLADASAVCSSSLLEAELSYMTAGLGLQLVKAAVVHLADGATAITGEQDAPPPPPPGGRARLLAPGPSHSTHVLQHCCCHVRTATAPGGCLPCRNPILQPTRQPFAISSAVSMNHVVGDFSTMRCLLHHWSAAFSGRQLGRGPAAYKSSRIEALAADDTPPGFCPQVGLDLGHAGRLGPVTADLGICRCCSPHLAQDTHSRVSCCLPGQAAACWRAEGTHSMLLCTAGAAAMPPLGVPAHWSAHS
jgi:hypothetical protein